MSQNTEQEVPSQTGRRGTTESPLDLSAPDWKESAKRALKEFKADRGTLTSAGLAFYWFLAIFPSVLAAVGFLGLAGVSDQFLTKLVNGIKSALPGDAGSVLTGAVTNAHKSGGGSAVAAVVGLLLALWSATSGMVALQIGLGVAYDVEQDRTFVKQRVTALLLSAVAVVLGGVATVLIVFGKPLGSGIKGHLPIGGTVFDIVWTVARWGVALAALVVLLAAFYYLAPNREAPRWSWVSPGGLVAAAMWLLASLGFSFYVSNFGKSSYAKTYGSLAGVVLLLLWLFLTALAVVVGAELNAELERQGARLAGNDPSRAGGGRRSAPPPSPRPDPVPPGDGRPGSSDRRPGPPEERRANDDGQRLADWAERMRQLRQGAGTPRG